MISTRQAKVSGIKAHDPFGMLLVGRNWEGGSEYRYGFNREESDSEAYGDNNIYDYGFRIYSPRLGKFLSVDPLTKTYPMLTPYQFASNTPIQGIDLDGLEIYYTTSGELLGRVGKTDLRVKNVSDNWGPTVAMYINWTNTSKTQKDYDWNYSVVNNPTYTFPTNIVAGKNDTKISGFYGHGGAVVEIPAFSGAVEYQRFKVPNAGTWEDGNDLRDISFDNFSFSPSDMADIERLDKVKSVANYINANAHLGGGSMTVKNMHGYSIVDHLNSADYEIGASVSYYKWLGVEAGGNIGKSSNGTTLYSNWYLATGIGFGGGVDIDIPNAGNNWHPIFNIDSLNVAKTNMMESVPGTKAHNDWSDTYKKQKSKTE